ncbi:MAG: hypothetical protein AAGA73_02160 [Pseudomonadota bacterium]
MIPSLKALGVASLAGIANAELRIELSLPLDWVIEAATDAS